jgi:drug/metabolite transporter (DMT)-like permease
MIMEILNKIIAVSVGLLVLALLFPIALNTLANATMTKVDPTVVTVVTVLVPVLAAVGVALYFLPSIRD